MRWAKQHSIDEGLMGNASAPNRHHCILCKAVQQVIKSALKQSVIVQWFHRIGGL